jgi:uracil-DNA glycosylase
MNVQISNSWKTELQEEFEKDYFKHLVEFVRSEYARHICYPKGNEIFAAFNHCDFNQVKVVIIGQDPYHGKDQANGLCFSVHKGIPHPPSLMNIFKELEKDTGKNYPQSGDLTSWADQGVLLINATLTVRSGEAGSHQKQGWETFTDSVIQKLSIKSEGLVFLLWGGFAKKKGVMIDKEKHLILTSGHPSPLSANRGYWFGNNHFSRTNEYLRHSGRPEIQW